MPEATVCKQCNLRCAKDEVGTARKARRTKMPPAYSQLGQMSANSAFSGLIVGRTNRLHIAAACWLCPEIVVHNGFPHWGPGDVVYNALPIE
jgi:hypothetical protein